MCNHSINCGMCFRSFSVMLAIQINKKKFSFFTTMLPESGGRSPVITIFVRHNDRTNVNTNKTKANIIRWMIRCAIGWHI